LRLGHLSSLAFGNLILADSKRERQERGIFAYAPRRQPSTTARRYAPFISGERST
jgi:hypothetical protein